MNNGTCSGFAVPKKWKGGLNIGEERMNWYKAFLPIRKILVFINTKIGDYAKAFDIEYTASPIGKKEGIHWLGLGSVRAF